MKDLNVERVFVLNNITTKASSTPDKMDSNSTNRNGSLLGRCFGTRFSAPREEI